MNAELIDKIYESCFVPETWPEVLEEIGRIGDAPGSALILFQGEQRCVASPEPASASNAWSAATGAHAARSFRGCSLCAIRDS